MTISDVVTELFPVVSEDGTRIGAAPRASCHADPTLIHPSVHVIVTTAEGVLWQLRGHRKDTAASTWDHACTGHVGIAEEPAAAAVREIDEELGLHVRGDELEWVTQVVVRMPHETELTTVFKLHHEGPFTLRLPELAGLAVLPGGRRPAPLAPSCAILCDELDAAYPGWDA